MTESITLLPLIALRESPTNPRCRYSDTSLQELADSISTRGVMSPIVVRPLDQTDIECTHEIVFGHRRSRAARLAGLDEVPVIVREMSDEEASLAQLHENLHRDDVHPVEEAEAFAAMLERHHVTVERLVLDSGKSRSYIYGRLKLAKMAPQVREACIEQGLGAEIGLLVARLPAHKLQAQALARLRAPGSPGDWVSYRYAKKILSQYTVRLHEASFDLADKSLPGGACASCPKIACNDPDLSELAADVCTDTECHDTKTAAQAQRVVALARESGHLVIEGADAEAISPHPSCGLRGHVKLSGTAYVTADANGERCAVSWQTALHELPGQIRSMIKQTLIVIPGHETEPVAALTEGAAAWVLTALGRDQPEQHATTPSTAARAGDGDDDEEPAWSPAAELIRDKAAWADVLRGAVRHTMQSPRTLAELRMLVQREIDIDDGLEIVADVMGLDAEIAAAQAQAEAADDEFSRLDWLTARVAELDADAAGALLVSIALVDTLQGGAWVSRRSAERKVVLATSLGIDVLALAAEVRQRSQPADAGPAGGHGASTADLFESAP